MRLIGTFKNQDHQLAYDLSIFLERHGVINQLEIETNKDWGSANYGDTTSRLWIIEEDQLDAALGLKEQFLNNPQSALENMPMQKKNWLQESLKEEVMPLKNQNNNLKPIGFTFGVINSVILAICTLFLLISYLTTPRAVNLPESLSENVFLASPLHRILLFDYPYAFEIMDKIIKAYGLESLQNPSEMSPQEQILIKTFNQTPYWKGFYGKILKYFTKGETLSVDAPLFEKIRQGQIWRLISPIFLHYDIFHLFFNMIWLIVIGKQIEQRLSTFRYLTFIIITGIISNTFQYLMTGPIFIGFSGVLCAMITFVRTRQKTAAWEGYQMQTSTFNFVMIFIIAMFGIQLLSFFLEIYARTSFSPGIANTAHLTGAVMGALLGRLDYFAYNKR